MPQRARSTSLVHLHGGAQGVGGQGLQPEAGRAALSASATRAAASSPSATASMVDPEPEIMYAQAPAAKAASRSAS